MERAAMKKTKLLTGIELHLCNGKLETPVPTTELPHPGKWFKTGYTQMLYHNQIDEKILGGMVSIYIHRRQQT